MVVFLTLDVPPCFGAVRAGTFPLVEAVISLTFRLIDRSHRGGGGVCVWLWCVSLSMVLNGHVGVSVTQGQWLDGTTPRCVVPVRRDVLKEESMEEGERRVGI